MTTSYEGKMYRDITRIADELEKVSTALGELAQESKRATEAVDRLYQALKENDVHTR